jgi:Protein of unknown function (DUF1616)
MPGKGPVRSIDLLLTILGALIGVGVALITDGGALATVILLPLVFVLPGYALSAAVFPPRTIGRDLRLVLTVVLSLAAIALGGLILNLVTVLERGTFVGLLAVVTIAAAVVALNGRQGSRSHRSPHSQRPRPSIGVALALTAAIGLAGAAIAIASAGAHRQLDEAHFSGLWLVPQGGTRLPPDEPPVLVGIANQEGKAVDYRLTVHQGGTEIGTWKVRLGDGQEWETTLPADQLGHSGTLVASLHLFRQTYRRVSLELGAGTSPATNG